MNTSLYRAGNGAEVELIFPEGYNEPYKIELGKDGTVVEFIHQTET
jgi:hypothetical protein